MIERLKNLEFYIPLFIGAYLIAAFRFKVFVLPFSFGEIEFLNQYINITADGKAELFQGSIPNIPVLIYYLIINIFGTNITIIRSVAALFAVINIFVVWKFGNFFFGKQAGIFAATITIVQNVYLAQFATVLPDTINSTLIIAAFYCFLREKYRTMAIWLVLAVNINISSILTVLFLLVAFLAKLNTQNKSQSIVFFVIPIMVYATAEAVNFTVFNELGVLKNFSLANFINEFSYKTEFVFILQQRICLVAIFAIALTAAALQRQIEKYEVKTYVYVGVLMILLTAAHALVQTELRQLVTAVTLLAIITSAAVSEIKIFYSYKYIIISILIIFFAVFAARSRNTSSEYIAYTNQTETDMSAAKYASENIPYDDTVMCSQIFYKILSNKHLGYISTPLTNIDTVYSTTKYSYIIKGQDSGNKLINAVLLEDNCLLEKAFTKKDAETEVYSIEK